MVAPALIVTVVPVVVVAVLLLSAPLWAVAGVTKVRKTSQEPVK